jgi:hypothetical protein
MTCSQRNRIMEKETLFIKWEKNGHYTNGILKPADHISQEIPFKHFMGNYDAVPFERRDELVHIAHMHGYEVQIDDCPFIVSENTP